MKKNFIIFKNWKDELLVWNSTSYGGITILRFSIEKIWNPGLIQICNLLAGKECI